MGGKQKIVLAGLSILILFFSSVLFAGISELPEKQPNGEGTQQNPYQIESLKNLAWMSNEMHFNDMDFSGVYFKQIKDIDASPTQNENYFDGNGFLPISHQGSEKFSSTSHPFSGKYNGNDHVISGLYIDRGSMDAVGLFGGMFGTVKNLGLEDVDITGNDWVGGLAGSTGFDKVTESYTTGSVSGAYRVGGLVGENSGSLVENSYSTASVSGAYKVGGLVGANGDTVQKSYSTGLVNNGNPGETIGGLIGTNNGLVTDSFWDTETSGQDSSAGGTGLSTSEMKDISTFQDVWTIEEVEASQDDYPYLAWEDGVNSVWRQKQAPDRQPPNAGFTYIPAEPKVEKEVQFDASDSNDPDGNIVSYQWDLGDGTTATGDKVTHTYTDDKTYTVKLTVTDNDGLTDTASTELDLTYEREYVQVENSRWSMVSAPLEPADKAPTSVFSGLNNPNEIYHWDPELEEFLTPDDDYDKVKPFHGAWIYLEESQVPKVFTIPGVYSGNVTITLKNPGWHQVGIPLEYGWSDIGVTKEGKETMTIATQASGPASPHWMSWFVWDYDSEAEEYTAYEAGNSSFTLQPGKAYWVRTREENVKIVIPHAAPPPTPSTASEQSRGIQMDSQKAEKLGIPNPPAPPATLSVGEFTVNAMPNPLTSNDQVTFIAAGSDLDSFQVNVYDPLGKQIHVSPRQSGHTYTWKPEGSLANGLYMYQVTAQKSTGKTITEIGKLLVLR